jgi:hypothetical protein
MASFDPLASSQINVDPSLKPKPSKELAVRRQQLIEMFMSKGMDAQAAAQEADRYMADYPVATGQQVSGPAVPAPAAPVPPQDSMEADLYGQGYSADEARTQARIQAEMQAEREAEELQQGLSQGGYGQRRVPGPRDLSGNAPMGTPFASVKDGQAYSERTVDEVGRPVFSQRDVAMRERGFVPVQTPDGETAYQLEYSGGPSVGPGQRGYRQGLVDSGKYEYKEMPGMGGVGKVHALAPTEQFRQQMVEQNARVKAAQDKRNPYSDLDSPAERMKRFQAQIQLGGGRLSPQSIQLETMLHGMTPEQRQRSLQYMAPGGALAAEVDARRNQDLIDLGKRVAMNPEAFGNKDNPVAQAQIDRQKAEDRAKTEEDLGSLYAPSGMAGYDEFELDEQQLMYDDLIAKGYTDTEARRAVDQQARKRRATRFLFGAKPAAPAPAPAGGAAPLPPGFVPPV